MILFRPIRNIPIINLATRSDKFFRLFRHSNEVFTVCPHYFCPNPRQSAPKVEPCFPQRQRYEQTCRNRKSQFYLQLLRLLF